MKPALKHAAAAIILLLFILISALSLWKVYLNHRINVQIAVLKAMGCPTTGEELNAFYPTPPAGQNAAEFYKKAVDAMDKGEGLTLPFVGRNIMPGEKIPENELLDSKKYLELNAKTMEYLNAAVKLKECRMPVDLSKGMQMDFSQLIMSNRLQFVRMFCFDAMVAAESGDSQRAAQDALNAFAVGQSMEKEPTLISKLVQIACYAIPVKSAEDTFARTKVDSSMLRQLQAKAAEIEETFSMKHGMLGEAALLIVAKDSYGKMLDQQTLLLAQSYINPPFWETFAVRVHFFGISGLDRLNLEKTLEYYSKLIASFDMPLSKELEASDAFKKEVENASLANFFSRNQVYSMHNIAPKHVEIIVRLRAMRAAIAVELYRRENGRLPDKLDELVPKYLPGIPSDPFNNDLPLKFIKGQLNLGPMPNDNAKSIIKSGFAVYSIGKDKTDNNAQDCLSPMPPDICFVILDASK